MEVKLGKHLILAGGGHAHMVTLANLNKFVDKGHNVTVVGPSIHHYYSGMGPGMLGKTYNPEDIRFATRDVVEKRGGIFIKGKAVRVDPNKKILFLESGEAIHYDIISFNAGSHVPRSIISGSDQDIFTVKPIERLMEARQCLEALMPEKKITISIVGGGPSSAEIAGNVWQLATRLEKQGKHGISMSSKTSGTTSLQMPLIQIFAGKKFMPRFPEKIRKMVMNSIRSRGIDIHETGYVKQVQDKSIVMESGERHPSDFVFIALGVKPSTIFETSGLPTGPDRGLLVNRFLQCTEYPEIFGGGDCIHFRDNPLDKVGVYAVRENPILFHNLMAYLENQPLRPFDPGGDYLLIFNLGSKYGVLNKKWFSLKGKAAFIIKDYIDRKFMKEFQAIE